MPFFLTELTFDDKKMKDFIRTCIYSIILHFQIQTEAVSTFKSTMCLEHALEIQSVLNDGKCPERLLESRVQPCRYTCMGQYAVRIGHKGCIGYNISFNLTGVPSSTFKSFSCGIKLCSVDFIRFTCWKNDSWNIVIDTSNYKLLNNLTTGKNDTLKSNNGCISKATIVGLVIGCATGGVLLGSVFFQIISCLRRRHNGILKTQIPTSVHFRQRHADATQSHDGRIEINSQDAQYSDIEEPFKNIHKGTQVPSDKEDSSLTTRSQETIYHHLNDTEDSLNYGSQLQRNTLFSSEFPAYGYEDSKTIRELQKGSPSLRSVVIHIGSISSKSSNDTKTSPTGSDEGHRYYALEKEYLMLQPSDTNSN